MFSRYKLLRTTSGPQKFVIFWLSKSIFYVWNYPKLSKFFSLKNIILVAHFSLLTFFKNFNFWSNLLLKMSQIFVGSEVVQSTMQSRFSDIKFSDNLWISDYFTKTIFSIYYIKSFDLVTLCNLMTVFVETRSVNKSRLHCSSYQKNIWLEVTHLYMSSLC